MVNAFSIHKLISHNIYSFTLRINMQESSLDKCSEYEKINKK